MSEIVFRDGDIIDVLGQPIQVRIGTFEELHIPWICEPGMCTEDESIQVRIDRGDPQETLLHEYLEQVKYQLIKAAKRGMEDLIHGSQAS